MTQPPISASFSRRSLLSLLGTFGLSVDGRASMESDIQQPRASSIIQIFLQGGPSHIDMFDPKPNAPLDIRGEFQAISTSIPGVHFSEHLPRLAQLMDRSCLLRCFAHTITDHHLGSHYVLTGDRSTNREAPLIGSVVAKHFGWQVPPPFVAIDRTVSGAGVLGSEWKPLELGGDCKSCLYDGVDPTDPEDMSGFRARRELLDTLNSSYRMQHGVSLDPIGYQSSQARAWDLATSATFRNSINPELEPVEIQEAYGKTKLGRRLLTARRLVETGAKYVSVLFPGWDTHFANFSRLRKLLPELDQAMSALILDLETRGLLSSTAVFVYGEFGRTPKITPGKTAGRGHWAKASSVLCFGQMFKQGCVYGETDDHGSDPVNGRVSPEDFVKTILHLAGSDPAIVQLPAGRKFVASGRVVNEILT